jgi:hypothetical protein
MTKLKENIYPTEGGCFRVGKRFYAHIDGALREASKAECRAGKSAGDEDLVRVNSEDFINAVYDVWKKQDEQAAFLRKYEDRN